MIFYPAAAMRNFVKTPVSKKTSPFLAFLAMLEKSKFVATLAHILCTTALLLLVTFCASHYKAEHVGPIFGRDPVKIKFH